MCHIRILGFVGALATLFVVSLSSADERPNFVVVIADDMAVDDCSPMGHPTIRTPNLERLAADGMVFDRAFLTCSSCSPSRSSILTGRYPHATDAEQLHWPLPAEQVTFAEILQQNGYYTAASGKWHLGPHAKRGFAVVDEASSAGFQLPAAAGDQPAIMVDSENASGCNGWVKTLTDRPRDKPFFLWLAAFDPHRDYQDNILAQAHDPNEVTVPPYLPDTPKVRQDLANYYDEITRLDGYLGAVLDELHRQNVAEQTYVIFLSDNGRPFPRCKTTLFDSGVQTPFIVSRPGTVPAGQRTTALISSIDLAATILELAKVSAPATLQGKSFSSVLRDATDIHRDYVFAEHNWHDYDAFQRSVRSTRYKYIRSYDAHLPLTPPADAVRSPTFVEMRRLRDSGELPAQQMQCFSVPRASEEFYDLLQDPHELVNLASDPQYQELLAAHRLALQQWREATDDIARTYRSPDEFDRELGTGLPQRKRPRLGKQDGFEPLFNGKDLTGWQRTNTAQSTWQWKDGVLVCSGKPIGELRTEKMYQNFVMELEWKHLVPKGNAGVFVWADDITARGVPFHRGVEVQVLENAYGQSQYHTTHGDIFPIHGAQMTPLNGRGGSRAFPSENRSLPSPEWNHYRIVCQDGEIALSVNGQRVTRGYAASPRKGYICLESEGGVVHYRNVRIRELPSTPLESAADTAIMDRGFQAIYQGIDLEGWSEDPVSHWRVNDWLLAHEPKQAEESSQLVYQHAGDQRRLLIDFKRGDEASQLTIEFQGEEFRLADPAVNEALSKVGTWDRLEMLVEGDQAVLRVNGQMAIRRKRINKPTTDPLRLQATGRLELCNLYLSPR